MSFMRFSTEDVPVHMRREVVEQAYRAHVPGYLDFHADAPVKAEVMLRALGDVQIASLDTSPLDIHAPATDKVYLSIADGYGIIDARGKDVHVKPGDVNTMRHGMTVVATHSRILSVAIPRSRLVPMLDDVDSLDFSHNLSNPAARMLQVYAWTMFDGGREMSAAEQNIFSSHIVDLASLLFGGKRDAIEQARRGGARAARRRAIQGDARAHIDYPELSLEWLSRRHGVSVPYIRALFYDQGTSFTDFVTTARLEKVADLLTNPELSDSTIATIALMAGFGDISWFNQLFRRHFGMTPSDMRANAATTIPKPV